MRISKEDAESIIRAICRAAGDHGLNYRLRCVSDTYENDNVSGFKRLKELVGADAEKIGELLKAVGGPSDESDGISPAFATTDVGNGRRFANRFRDLLFHCTEEGLWYVWTKNHWRVDVGGVAVTQLAKLLCYEMKVLAEKMADAREAERLRRWAATSESRSHIESMIALARSELAVSVNQLNQDPMLLNVLNGTLDLRTRELRPHAPPDLITKVAPINFDPSATAPLFLATLNRAMSGNAEMVNFILVILGYCLSGDISAQYLFIFHGQGANGKSVIMDTTVALLGPYAGLAPPGLLEQSTGDRHPTEIAELNGLRLAHASESEEFRALRIQLVKQLTGDGMLKARRMRQDFFTFRRTHKLILVTNNKPRISEDSEAVWRRIVLIPFNVVIPPAERNPNLLEELRSEFSGILNLLLNGHQSWRDRGFVLPEDVKPRTNEYRVDESPIQNFVEEACHIDAMKDTPVRILYLRYAKWCEAANRRPLNERNFAEALRKIVPCIEKVNLRIDGNQTKCWKGIGIQVERY